jgi:carbamoyltransferase
MPYKPIKTLAIHTTHDAGVAVFNDYDLCFIAKEERLNRVKNFGYAFPELSFEKLKREVDISDVNILILTRGVFPRKYFHHEPLLKKIERNISEWVKDKKKMLNLGNITRDTGLKDEDVFNVQAFMNDLGLPTDCKFHFANHHWCHALPTLFYRPQWDNALLYTADGGGDFIQYSLTHFNGKSLNKIYGGDDLIYDTRNDEKCHSVGQMYSIVTQLAGFRPTRHEGKITGLAAYGKPAVYNQLRLRYSIRQDGLIRSDFESYKELLDFMKHLSKQCSIEDLSASAQKVLENVMAESVRTLQTLHKFSNIGLSGGVFANVRLNQIISEIDGIKEIFIFPAMGDEGLTIGACLSAMLEQNDLTHFLKKRRDLGTIYWGDIFNNITSQLENDFQIITENNIPKQAAKLLNDGNVCALFTNGMEFGPRALGARSILINPADNKINDLVNKRLSRTEFMPFAPVIREERVDDVFVVTSANRNAMQYMTITCNVRLKWQDRIPAVVHIDGTARPQTIRHDQNPLYYEILQSFEDLTGLPCLVNTSFNAHEEPIINTPTEALKALRDNRIDYLITDSGIIGTKQT